MKLGIVGAGTVGKALARAFVEHVDELRVFDVLPGRATHPLADVVACDLVMVALPSPQKAGSLECDLSAVEGFFASVRGSRANLVLRSTVPVGTTRKLASVYDLPGLCHSPEFLTARTAATDAHLPSRNVIGNVGRMTSTSCGARLHALYSSRYPGVPVHVMTSDESELVKLAQNSLFACKVALMNELNHFAASAGMDWHRVLAAILADGRIAHSHTTVPGHSGYGFSGNCLPKDLANLVACIEANGLSAAVTRAAYERNLDDRRRAV